MCVKLCRLLRRHALTCCDVIRCVTMLNFADYSVVTLKSFICKGLRISDYSAVTRKSRPDKKMWPNGTFSLLVLCARGRDVSKRLRLSGVRTDVCFLGTRARG